MGAESLKDEEDRIQRALNEAKKRELEEKYGANFGGDNKHLPSAIESQWLNYIEEFERQFENAKQVTVLEFVGNPTFKALAEIPPEQLGCEVESVLEFLGFHGISVDFLCETSDAVAYQFLTTELMNAEIDDVHIDGMMHCFIYEEFHPNDAYDVTMFADIFLWNLFERHEKDVLQAFPDNEIYDIKGNRIDREQMQRLVQAFYGQWALFTYSKHENLNCTVDGDYAKVTFDSEWRGLNSGTMEEVVQTGISTLRMKRSPYSGWDIVQINVTGWNNS